MVHALDRQPFAGFSRPSNLQQVRATLSDGAATTVHVAEYDLARTRLRVRRLPELAQLERWCGENEIDEAIVGGFYIRGATQHSGKPLGELWVEGERMQSLAFAEPWNELRACIHVDEHEVHVARRGDVPAEPAGDLLQAGPLLVRNGEVVTGDEEGFSAGAHQFDSDITAGRHPRAALGTNGNRLIAVACDGRSNDDAGLGIDELAEVMLELGSCDALNLDGGGSTSLVCGGKLANVPREAHGVPVVGGRAIATALVFEQR